MPDFEALSIWSEFGLPGLVIGALFLLLIAKEWWSHKDRTESRQSIDKVMKVHEDAVKGLAGEIKAQSVERTAESREMNATLREFNATIAAANRR